jgi:hypothetical protein
LKKELAKFVTDGNEPADASEEEPRRTEKHEYDKGDDGKELLKPKLTVPDTSVAINQTNCQPIEPNGSQTSNGNESRGNLAVIIDIEQREDGTKGA